MAAFNHDLCTFVVEDYARDPAYPNFECPCRQAANLHPQVNIPYFPLQLGFENSLDLGQV